MRDGQTDRRQTGALQVMDAASVAKGVYCDAVKRYSDISRWVESELTQHALLSDELTLRKVLSTAPVPMFDGGSRDSPTWPGCWRWTGTQGVTDVDDDDDCSNFTSEQRRSSAVFDVACSACDVAHKQRVNYVQKNNACKLFQLDIAWTNKPPNVLDALSWPMKDTGFPNEHTADEILQIPSP